MTRKKSAPNHRIPAALTRIMALTGCLMALHVHTSLYFPASLYADDALVYVQVRSTSLYSQPQHFSSVRARAQYGDALTNLGQEGAWTKVRSPKRLEGYVHTSALSARRLSLDAGKTLNSGSVADADISLAGKGFSAAVEKQLAAENRALNFTEVDRMEKISVNQSEVSAFVKGGKLGSQG